MNALFQRTAFAFAVFAIGLVPAACSSGTSALPSTVDGSAARSVSSGGVNAGGANAGGGNTAPPTSGGGGNSKPLPGSMPFTFGCGSITNVSNSVTVNPGGANASIATRVGVISCDRMVYFRTEFENMKTRQVEFMSGGWANSTLPYWLTFTHRLAQINTSYQAHVFVWDATAAASQCINIDCFSIPLDPAWIMATESFSLTTAGAPLGVGGA